MYTPNISLTSVVDGMGDRVHASVILPLGKKLSTHCVGSWLGPVWTGEENLAPNGITR